MCVMVWMYICFTFWSIFLYYLVMNESMYLYREVFLYALSLRIWHKINGLCDSHGISGETFFGSVNSKKRTGIFEGKMPNLVGKKFPASLAPNPNLIASLESLWSVVKNRLFERVKQTFRLRKLIFTKGNFCWKFWLSVV